MVSSSGEASTSLSAGTASAAPGLVTAIALATAYLHDVQGVPENEAVVVCPVDPYIEREYIEALKELGRLAAEGTANLTLMGIEPTYPSEKYGYIIPESKENVSKVSLG